MFDRFMEYREAQQFRKDRMMKQRTRQLFIFMAILGVLAGVISVVNAIAPPAKSDAPTVSTTVSTANQQEMQDIREFADVVTKPLDELTKEDLDLVEAKAGDPCYEKNAKLPADQMVEAIASCKSLK